MSLMACCSGPENLKYTGHKIWLEGTCFCMACYLAVHTQTHEAQVAALGAPELVAGDAGGLLLA